MFQHLSSTALCMAPAATGQPAATTGWPPAAAYTVDSPFRKERTALRQLRRPPFAPTDVGLLDTRSYPQGPAMVPEAPHWCTAQQLAASLRRLLQTRGGVAMDHRLQVFRDLDVSTVVQEPVLRAALTSLAGTPGQGSIAAIRRGVFRKVCFGRTPEPSAVAQVVTDGRGRPMIVVNERYRFENFRLLGVALAHETLHQGPEVVVAEEVIASALVSALYGRLVLEDPKLAASRTELSRRLNTGLVALLNTRDGRGNQRLTTSTGNVLPGSMVPLSSFGEAFLGPGSAPAGSPGNANLAFFLNSILAGKSRYPDFNGATVKKLDRRQSWASAAERLRLARILRLDTGS
ncbi:hypothetical protein [Arthrobacter mobilis]|uniref:Uncharacterized protein n=1 Tax=Arthrobacter mobilis TaxID=2724944 RepID=A0A7X6HBU7_9MICC|nr:hypothetical protein [Arthrobacter mobilis]NKX53016.1 hypothetical protein [Arthrobacter mobilis]